MLFSVAIDGPSGAGKSTIARAVAHRMGALYLDTGAMYRAVGLAMLRKGIDPGDAAAVSGAVADVDVRIGYDHGVQRVYLSSEDVSEAIRTPEASAAASAVSAVPAVRERLVAMQRAIAEGQSVVMDGRDIGTHVLPDATLKIYLVASSQVRAARRYREMRAKGACDSFEQVLSALEKRDHDDSTRAASPLRRAEDALEIDASELTAGEVVERVVALLNQRIGGTLS